MKNKSRIRRRLLDDAITLVNVDPMMTTQSQLAATLAFASTMTTLPPQQLSIEKLNPVATIWSYQIFLFGTLGIWILYLLLPRGVRKQYFNSNRKRYARNTDTSMPPAGYWAPVKSLPSMEDGSRRASSVVGGSSVISSSAPGEGSHRVLQAPRAAHSQQQQQQRHHLPPPPIVAHTPIRASSSYRDNPSTLPTKTPPSPEHPALSKIPPSKVLAETMGRLQGRGIRLIAHGVHCDPKRVWIQLDEETNSVSWQTEFPRRVPNQSGQVSIVLMRGSLHRIALANVLYIDVGKKTSALNKLERVANDTCFSLLTQNGSLDLQANSKLERDSLVSCFSMILDDVHQGQNWRALYEQSPDPSVVSNLGPPNRTSDLLVTL